MGLSEKSVSYDYDAITPFHPLFNHQFRFLLTKYAFWGILANKCSVKPNHNQRHMRYHIIILSNQTTVTMIFWQRTCGFHPMPWPIWSRILTPSGMFWQHWRGLPQKFPTLITIHLSIRSPANSWLYHVIPPWYPYYTTIFPGSIQLILLLVCEKNIIFPSTAWFPLVPNMSWDIPMRCRYIAWFSTSSPLLSTSPRLLQ